jgi:hypothetical protein
LAKNRPAFEQGFGLVPLSSFYAGDYNGSAAIFKQAGWLKQESKRPL